MKKALLKKLLLLGEILFGLILALVIIISVFPFIPPFKNYYHSRTVLTGSMGPKIPKGSVVINQWADQKNLKIGDVITYRHPSDKKIIYITHRIVKIDKNGLLWRFETKGDANPAPDFGLITQAGTEGKVILMIPLIGYLIEFFKTLVGFILLVALPLLIFIVLQTKDVLKIWKKRNDLPARVDLTKRKTRKTLVAILLAFSFLAARISFVTYASFTSGQATITGVTLSTATSFPGDVVINEVYYRGDSNVEWVELYNAGNAPVDLNGWKIQDNTQTDVLSSVSLILNPDQFAVMVGTDNSAQVIASGAIRIILGNTAVGNGLVEDGDRLILKNNLGDIVDQMNYRDDIAVWNPARAGVVAGHSLARFPKGYDTDQPSDFVDNSAPNPGTNPHPPEEPATEPTPTPSPTPETSPTPTPTPIQSGPTPETSPTPTPTAEPSPTPVPSTTPSPSSSPEPSPTALPEPSFSPSPEPTSTSAPTLEPTPTLTPTPSPTSEL